MLDGVKRRRQGEVRDCVASPREGDGASPEALSPFMAQAVRPGHDGSHRFSEKRAADRKPPVLMPLLLPLCFERDAGLAFRAAVEVLPAPLLSRSPSLKPLSSRRPTAMNSHDDGDSHGADLQGFDQAAMAIGRQHLSRMCSCGRLAQVHGHQCQLDGASSPSLLGECQGA